MPHSFGVDAWIPYFSTIASVAATLTGLGFVAVSLNLSAILEQAWLADRAAESLLQLLEVVLIATSALIPRQPPHVLGIEILVITMALWVVQIVRQIYHTKRHVRRPFPLRLMRFFQTQCTGIPLFVGSILLIQWSPNGLYWLAPGLVASLLSGVVNAWVLLVEIRR